MRFLFSVNVYVFIMMMLFKVKNVKIGFLCSVNTCLFVIMMPFIVKIFLKVVKNKYTGEWLIFFCFGL